MLSNREERLLDTVSAVNKSRIVHAAVHRGAGCKSRFKDRPASSTRKSLRARAAERVSGKPAVRGWNHLLPVASRVGCTVLFNATCASHPVMPHRIVRPDFRHNGRIQKRIDLFFVSFFLLLSSILFFFPRSFVPVSFLGVRV